MDRKEDRGPPSAPLRSAQCADAQERSPEGGTPLEWHADLRAANLARQAEWTNGEAVSLGFRAVELGGEVGEALNVVKKLERERAGWRGSRASVDDLAAELADVVICADLLAMTEGIDLAEAVARKFNATSEKVGLRTRLMSPFPRGNAE